MSADNYYVVRKRSDGKFCPVMGFASDDYNPDGEPTIKPSDPLSARVAVEIEIALGRRCADVLMAMQAYHDVHIERTAQRDRIAAIAALLGDEQVS